MDIEKQFHVNDFIFSHFLRQIILQMKLQGADHIRAWPILEVLRYSGGYLPCWGDRRGVRLVTTEKQTKGAFRVSEIHGDLTAPVSGHFLKQVLKPNMIR